MQFLLNSYWTSHLTIPWLWRDIRHESRYFDTCEVHCNYETFIWKKTHGVVRKNRAFVFIRIISPNDLELSLDRSTHPADFRYLEAEKELHPVRKAALIDTGRDFLRGSLMHDLLSHHQSRRTSAFRLPSIRIEEIRNEMTVILVQFFTLDKWKNRERNDISTTFVTYCQLLSVLISTSRRFLFSPVKIYDCISKKEKS